MPGRRTQLNKIAYMAPTPFTLPCIEVKSPTALHWWETVGPVTLIPHEALQFSSKILEEIMYYINIEYEKRQRIKPTWKKYRSSSTDFTTFVPVKTGTQLSSVPLKYFHRYVLDIQDAIDALITDVELSDNRASYLARIFCNNTPINGADTFNDANKLKDNIGCPGGSTHDPLTLAKAGNWPFGSGYFTKIAPVKPVSLRGERHNQVKYNEGLGSLEAKVPGYPAPEIGKRISPGVVDGFDAPMTAATRPVISRIATENTSQGVGAGLLDTDLGYNHFAHDPKIIHQLRWQPPNIEFWPDPVPTKDFVSNVYSNTTPNLPWYFGQQVETTWKQNWGYWLMKGRVGVADEQLTLQVYQNPMAEYATAALCPYAVFYPPDTIYCSCQWIENAYAIWFMNGFKWNEQTFYNSSYATHKYFGPKTKLIIKYNCTSTGGAGDTVRNRLLIGVRTARIAEMNQQPFSHVIDLTNPSGAGEAEVVLQTKMNEIWGDAYKIGGTDGISAISIHIESYVRSDWTCQAEYYMIKYPNGGVDGGKRVPADCPTQKTCTIPTFKCVVDWIKIEEPAITGDPVTNYR